MPRVFFYCEHSIQLFKFINFLCSCQCTYNATFFFSILPPTVIAAGHGRLFCSVIYLCISHCMASKFRWSSSQCTEKRYSWHRRRQRWRRWPCGSDVDGSTALLQAVAICIVHQKANNQSTIFNYGFCVHFSLNAFSLRKHTVSRNVLLMGTIICARDGEKTKYRKLIL